MRIISCFLCINFVPSSVSLLPFKILISFYSQIPSPLLRVWEELVVTRCHSSSTRNRTFPDFTIRFFSCNFSFKCAPVFILFSKWNLQFCNSFATSFDFFQTSFVLVVLVFMSVHMIIRFLYFPFTHWRRTSELLRRRIFAIMLASIASLFMSCEFLYLCSARFYMLKFYWSEKELWNKQCKVRNNTFFQWKIHFSLGNFTLNIYISTHFTDLICWIFLNKIFIFSHFPINFEKSFPETYSKIAFSINFFQI